MIGITQECAVELGIAATNIGPSRSVSFERGVGRLESNLKFRGEGSS